MAIQKLILNHPYRFSSFQIKVTVFLMLILLPSIFMMIAPTICSAGPKHGGTLIIALASEEPDLNPATHGGTAVMPVIQNICNQLITLDMDMNPIPSLATSWEISKDGLTYTFKLVENATWHDGKPFTSVDVICTIREIYPHHFRSGHVWRNLTVEAPDDYTVIIKFKKPYAPFMTVLGNSQSAPQILPAHIYGGTDIKKNPYNLKPIGTGPFVFKKWVKGSHIELVRNNNYFAKGNEDKPYLDRIIFKLLPDPASRLLSLKKGELDFMPSVTLPKEYVPELQKNPDIVVNTDEMGALPMKWVFFNLRKAPLSDKLVRHAIAYAIDREQILELAWRGMGKIGTSIVNSGMKWAFNPNLYGYPYDPQKANALLDKAGYPRGADGVRFKQRLHCIPARESEGRVAEIIKDQLKQVGIDIQIIATDRAAFVDSMFIRWDYDLAFQQGATAPDPAVGSRRFIHSDQIIKSAYKNGSGFSNPEVDYLLDQEVTEIDREKRAAMWHRIQEIFVEEVPMLPIYEDQLINVYRAEWADLITGPEGGSQTREHAYKKTE